MEGVFREQIHRLEEQLHRYTQAYEAQRELLYKLQAKLQTQQDPQNGRSPKDHCGAIQNSAILPEYSTVEPPSREPSIALSSPCEENGFQDRFAEPQQLPDSSPKAKQCIPATYGSPSCELSESLSESLAAASSDAARSFVTCMRRLWGSYFTHMRGEVRGVLRELDDAFEAFAADPREETLADLLELHQRLRPALSTVFGTLHTVEQREAEGKQEEGAKEEKEADAGLPPGNPLADSADLVRHLSLSVAEAVAPVFAVALRNRSRVTRSSDAQEENDKEGLRYALETWRGRRCGDDMGMDMRGQQMRRGMCDKAQTKRWSPSPQPVDPAENVREGMEKSEDVSGETGEEEEEAIQRQSFLEETDAVTPAKSVMSRKYFTSTLSRSDDRAVMASSEPRFLIRSPVRTRSSSDVRRQTNDSEQIESILYGNGTHSHSKSRSASLAFDSRQSATLSRAQNSTNPEPRQTDPNTPSTKNNGNHTNARYRNEHNNYHNDKEELEVDSETSDPHLHLRYLQRLEERAEFQVLNIAALRREHGSEAKYYALNKRLARIRSEVKRTEREVAELDHIKAEREALRRERERYNARRFGR